MSPWLKAGLIGAIILVVLSLLGAIPVAGVSCLTIPLTLLAYLGIGVLAASYMPPPCESGPAAGQGALAGLLAAIIGGLVTMVITIARSAMTGAQALSQIDPSMLRQLQDAGIPPELIAGPLGGAVAGSLCCGAGILFAMVLAAIGGAVYAAAKGQ